MLPLNDALNLLECMHFDSWEKKKKSYTKKHDYFSAKTHKNLEQLNALDEAILVLAADYLGCNPKDSQEVIKQFYEQKLKEKASEKKWLTDAFKVMIGRQSLLQQNEVKNSENVFTNFLNWLYRRFRKNKLTSETKVIPDSTIHTTKSTRTIRSTTLQAKVQLKEKPEGVNKIDRIDYSKYAKREVNFDKTTPKKERSTKSLNSTLLIVALAILLFTSVFIGISAFMSNKPTLPLQPPLPPDTCIDKLADIEMIRELVELKVDSFISYLNYFIDDSIAKSKRESKIDSFNTLFTDTAQRTNCIEVSSLNRQSNYFNPEGYAQSLINKENYTMAIFTREPITLNDISNLEPEKKNITVAVRQSFIGYFNTKIRYADKTTKEFEFGISCKNGEIDLKIISISVKLTNKIPH